MYVCMYVCTVDANPYRCVNMKFYLQGESGPFERTDNELNKCN